MRVTDKEMNKLTRIAIKHFGAVEERGSLNTRDNDQEDFFEVAVWCLKDALVEAYSLGKKEGAKHERTKEG